MSKHDQQPTSTPSFPKLETIARRQRTLMRLNAIGTGVFFGVVMAAAASALTACAQEAPAAAEASAELGAETFRWAVEAAGGHDADAIGAFAVPEARSDLGALGDRIGAGYEITLLHAEGLRVQATLALAGDAELDVWSDIDADGRVSRIRFSETRAAAARASVR